jgi:hypothetical protein
MLCYYNTGEQSKNYIQDRQVRFPIAVICKTYSVLCLYLNNREYITTARGSLLARSNWEQLVQCVYGGPEYNF